MEEKSTLSFWIPNNYFWSCWSLGDHPWTALLQIYSVITLAWYWTYWFPFEEKDTKLARLFVWSIHSSVFMLKHLNKLIYIGIDISYSVTAFSFLTFATFSATIYVKKLCWFVGFFSVFLTNYFSTYLDNLREAISRPARTYTHISYLWGRSRYQDKSK